MSGISQIVISVANFILCLLTCIAVYAVCPWYLYGVSFVLGILNIIWSVYLLRLRKDKSMKNDKILDDIISMLGKFKKSLSQLSKTEVKEQWGQINKRIEELVQSQKQNMKKEEHLEIINRLMPGIVQAAEEQNGLVPPDLETWTVLFRTLSVGFAMGRYFERTDPKSSMEERFASMISQAEQIRSDEF